MVWSRAAISSRGPTRLLGWTIGMGKGPTPDNSASQSCAGVKWSSGGWRRSVPQVARAREKDDTDSHIAMQHSSATFRCDVRSANL
eukprot:scaffold11543_cov128-Isochrysis_galbana.AAC.11